MRERLRWSIGLGRWRGVAIRLHVTFVCFAFVTLFLCRPLRGDDVIAETAGNLFWIAAVGLVVLAGSVLLHELGHYLVARRHGIVPDRLVIGPLGGLSPWRFPGNAGYELQWALAGPATNLLAALFLTALLLASEPQTRLWLLLHPLQPGWIGDAETRSFAEVLRIAVWINWLLCLVNFLPAHPFDGVRILRAATVRWNPTAGRKRIDDTVFWAGVVAAGVILTIAVVLGRQDTDAVFPSWFALVLLALVVLVGATRTADRPSRTESIREAMPERTRVRTRRCENRSSEPAAASECGADVHWAASDESSVEKREALEDRQLDDLLSRVHERGIGGLSERERRTLLRISVRYRNKLQKRS